MSVLIAEQGKALAEQTCAWIRAEQAKGARLFALEGLMSAGKTTTAKQVRALMPEIISVELDAFHDPRGADRPRTWDEALDHSEAVRHIRVFLENHSVLVEGAICWPTATKCGASTRYIYMKRMQFPRFWADQHELAEHLDPDFVLRRSVRDYHAAHKPWEKADLVLERLVEANGQ